MKNAERLNFPGLAAVLGQRGLVDDQRLRIALAASEQGPSPFPEVLVGDELVGDWELSRVVCDLYGLPFVPADLHEPDLDALEGLDHDFLRKHRLVPLGRHGDLLTVAMPALVSTEVLSALSAAAAAHVLPVVGTVETNNRWIDQNLVPEKAPLVRAEPAPEPAIEPAIELGWSNIFDEGDASVLLDLTDLESDEPPPIAPLPKAAPSSTSELPPLPPPPTVG